MLGKVFIVICQRMSPVSISRSFRLWQSARHQEFYIYSRAFPFWSKVLVRSNFWSVLTASIGSTPHALLNIVSLLDWYIEHGKKL